MYFLVLTFLVHKIFTFYINDMLNCKYSNFRAKGLKQLKPLHMFRSFQIIIREFRRSLQKLLRIHDLVRFCKRDVVAAYRVV